MRVHRTLVPCLALAALTACSERAPTPTDGGSPSFSQRGGAQDTTGGASHYTANGLVAQVNWFSGSFDSTTGTGSFDYGSVYAASINAVQNEAVFLSYYVVHCDAFFSCTLSEAGGGIVPKSALSGGGGTISLNVTPADFPTTFYVYGGTGGPVRISWRATGDFSSRTSGTSEYTYPWFRFFSNGVSTNSSALASGVVGSSTVPAGSFGSIGMNHAVTLSFSH